MSYKVENIEGRSIKAEWVGKSSEYIKLIVSEDLIIKFNLDDTWIVIRDDSEDVTVGLSEIDSLIEKLKEAKELIKKLVIPTISYSVKSLAYSVYF